MRLTAIALALALIAAPALAQEAAPASDTIKEVTAKGVIFDVMGMEIDMDFKADGKKLCLTIPGMIENQCTEYPDGKKSGDSFEVVTEMGAMNVKIR